MLSYIAGNSIHKCNDIYVFIVTIGMELVKNI